ncbi:staygreen family protein [Clostridium grantii]|uniref:Staygreen protein n=1 Tax=Clostridium grantii DSM 8605 TaxID=1121316 RepID=A0A1M5XYV8_9CLOT|nr:staygreen family protein [Clostridium grantii]SHI04991.1 Staygreen protein [Clostridium grantii DSM 8605]
MINDEKIKVIFLPGSSKTKPVVPRHYTFLCGDVNKPKELYIGLSYNYERIGFLQQEILAKWTFENKIYGLNIYYVVNENTSEEYQKNKLFETINIIQKADKEFIDKFTNQNFPEISVYFFDKNSNLLREEKHEFFKDNSLI